MIKCDTIKLKTNYKYLLNKKVNFNILYDSKQNRQNGEFYSSNGNSDIPFNLYLATNYAKQTLTLEFSSKLLFEDYPKLITKETLPQCLHNINGLGICTIDEEAVLNTACVTKAHITEDIPYRLTDDTLTALNNNVSNYRRFKWQHYNNKGITFTKNIVGKGKEDIKIYDKSKELIATVQNRQFLSLLSNREEVESYFSDKMRVEIICGTQPQIRKYLKIDHTYINDFFSSTANPILAQYDKVFDYTKPDSNVCADNYDSWAMSKILEMYNGNLQLIEQEVRSRYKFRSGATERMAKFEELHMMQNANQRNTVQEVAQSFVLI